MVGGCWSWSRRLEVDLALRMGLRLDCLEDCYQDLLVCCYRQKGVASMVEVDHMEDQHDGIAWTLLKVVLSSMVASKILSKIVTARSPTRLSLSAAICAMRDQKVCSGSFCPALSNEADLNSTDLQSRDWFLTRLML